MSVRNLTLIGPKEDKNWNNQTSKAIRQTMNAAVIVGKTLDTAYLFYFLNLNLSAIHLQGLNLRPAAYSFISFQVFKKKIFYIVHWDFNFSAVNFNELLILRNFGRNLPSALPTFTPGNQNRKELYTTQSAYKVFMLGISLRNIYKRALATSNAKKCCKGEWVLYGIFPRFSKTSLW